MYKFLFFPILLFSVMLQASENALKTKNPLALQLPPAIYAVPGVGINIYFENVVLTVNPNNYVFDVDCRKGYNNAKYWHFRPKEQEIGEYPLKIRILNSENQVVGQAETKLIVVPKNAGVGKNISLLMIGDSLTDASKYPRYVNTLFQLPENPKLRFIGSHSGGGRQPGPDGVCHEGYGGWRWVSFCSMWSNRKIYRAKSKFLVLKSGRKILDFKAYCAKYNNGVVPNFITIMIGTNDVFAANDNNIDKSIKSAFKYMDIFLKELVRVAPNAKIGIALTPPPAVSQDAFGANYKCGQTRWQFKRNQHRLVKAMIAKFKTNKNKNISLIPVCFNLDTENGFPIWKGGKRQCNGVHPAIKGYRQIGNSFYAWMKYQLAIKAKK